MNDRPELTPPPHRALFWRPPSASPTWNLPVAGATSLLLGLRTAAEAGFAAELLSAEGTPAHSIEGVAWSSVWSAARSGGVVAVLDPRWAPLSPDGLLKFRDRALASSTAQVAALLCPEDGRTAALLIRPGAGIQAVWNNLSAEDSLTSLTAAFHAAGIPVLECTADEPIRFVDNCVDLAHLGRELRRRTVHHLMLSGVMVEDPEATYVDAGVVVGAGTRILPGSHLRGKTQIGCDAVIGPDVTITDCLVGDRVTVQYAVMTESEVGDDSRVGPFCHLRPGCRIGRKVKLGNFVEVKNSNLEDGVSAGHLAYLGDSDVGARVNIGAGTITCNYDGRRKHRTRIGKGAFVGSHTTLVAPVSVGDGAYTAAGTVVTHDVPDDALAVGRTRQENKDSWAKRRRERESGHK